MNFYVSILNFSPKQKRFDKRKTRKVEIFSRKSIDLFINYIEKLLYYEQT